MIETSRPERALIVLPQAGIRRELQVEIEEGGLRVICAGDAQDARGFLSSRADRVDVAVIDALILETDVEFLRFIQDRDPETRIVVFQPDAAGAPAPAGYRAVKRPFVISTIVESIGRGSHPEAELPRILVVDDEADMVDCFLSMLDGRGWAVEAETSPLVALQKIRQRRFDVVVSDIRMPAMSGTELFREAVAIQPDLKVILISGQDYPGDATRQPFAFLAKPFKAERLAATVNSALTGS